MACWRRALRAILWLTILAGIFPWPAGTAQNGDAKQKTQDLAATWQGTLGPGQGMRVVIQITEGTRGEYRALFYNIDRSGDAVPGRALSQDGSTIKMTFTMVDGTYIGHLAPDGKSITGMWSQNSAPVPLNLTRAVAGGEWVIPTAAVKPRAMDPNADPAFEVATIKSSNPEDHRKFFRLRPDLLEGVNETVADMITFSYGVHRKQVVDAPPWIESERFDISAKPDTEGMPSTSTMSKSPQKIDLAGTILRTGISCYGFNTSRWSTQPPRKKRCDTMDWASRNMRPTRMANKRTFTNPNQGDCRTSEFVVFGTMVI